MEVFNTVGSSVNVIGALATFGSLVLMVFASAIILSSISSMKAVKVRK